MGKEREREMREGQLQCVCTVPSTSAGVDSVCKRAGEGSVRCSDGLGEMEGDEMAKSLILTWGQNKVVIWCR